MKQLQALPKEVYETPKAVVVMCHIEGVLCASDKETFTEEWKEVDLSGSGI